MITNTTKRRLEVYYGTQDQSIWIHLLQDEQDIHVLASLLTQVLVHDMYGPEYGQLRTMLADRTQTVLDVRLQEEDPEDPAADQPKEILRTLEYGPGRYGLLITEDKWKLDELRSPLLRINWRQGDEWVPTWEPYPSQGWPGDIVYDIDFDELPEVLRNLAREQVTQALLNLPRLIQGLRAKIAEDTDTE